MTDNGATKHPESVRKCWICLEEESESSQSGEVWSKPCKCSLDAHESCLQLWIINEQRKGTNPTIDMV